MDPANGPIVSMLNEIADILEITGSDRFRPIAYRRAARTVEALPRPVHDYIREGSISELPGVGEAISQKISEYASTGRLEYLEKLRSGIPPGLLELLNLQEVGPKTVGRLYLELKITSLDELQKACEEHRVSKLKGFGDKTEERILQSIAFYRGSSKRFLLSEGDEVAAEMIRHLSGQAHRIMAAGSLRRRRETIGDLDIIVASDTPESVMDRFVTYPGISIVYSRGETKSSILLKSGLQVDLRVVEDRSYGAALLYFTGSKDHNVELRNRAIDRGLKLNEYSLSTRDGEKDVAGESEEQVYSALGLQFIEPELREARGEIDAASAGRLPHLVEEGDIRGDMHCHTNWTDGSSPIEAMIEAAEARNYSYIGISDHSRSSRVARGLSEEKMERQIERIEKINASGKYDITVLCGSEVDILPDGKLDYRDELLSRLDYVIGSVHSRFNMDSGQMTERLLTAMSDEHLTILGHPTGRELGRREAYSFSTDSVFEEARSKGILLEINGSPERLDLNDQLVMEARRHGCAFVLSTDSHHFTQLSNMKYAVAMARRGWLEAADVANACSEPPVARRAGRIGVRGQ